MGFFFTYWLWIEISPYKMLNLKTPLSEYLSSLLASLQADLKMKPTYRETPLAVLISKIK